jgi:hypothetical protein
MMVNPKIARQTSPLKPKGVNDFDDFTASSKAIQFVKQKL